MPLYNHCPICGGTIQPDEKLIAYYHPPRDWWVIAHTGPGTDTQNFSEGTIQIPNAKVICQQARYEPPILIGQRGPG